MKRQLRALYHAALRDKQSNHAARIAAYYLREYGRPIPSSAASAVSEFLNSKPPFGGTTTHDHPTH